MCDIGRLGDHEGPRESYTISPVYAALRLLPFALLLALFAIPRNRNLRALWPLGVGAGWAILMGAFMAVVGALSQDAYNILSGLVRPVFYPFIIGMTAAWLTSGGSGRAGRVANLFLLMIWQGVFSVLALLLLCGTGIDLITGIFGLGLILGIWFITLLLTGACCRGRYTRGRVLFWPAFWLAALYASGLLVVGVLVVIAAGAPWFGLILMPFGGLFYGVLFYIMVFPYLALALWDRHFAERFSNIFPFPPAVQTEGRTETDTVGAPLPMPGESE